MTRTMVDSSTFTDIPFGHDIVAAYTDGHFGVVTQEQLETRFPADKYGHCLVDVNGSTPRANARDWETGDKAGSLEQWVGDHNNATGKGDAVVYCNKSTIPEVRSLTGGQVLGKDYWLWIATLDGSQYTAPGVIACQNLGSAQTGGHWDLSVVYDDRFFQKSGSVPVRPSRPDCAAFQRAVRTTMDNLWGLTTDQHASAIINACIRLFPFGVPFAQMVAGASSDGVWGSKSETALKDTVASCQRALSSMGFSPGPVDGAWGQHTSSAYTAARAACHI